MTAVDELWYDAATVCLEAGVGAISAVQGRLAVGHPRAVRLVQQLETLGIVGAPLGPTRARPLKATSVAELDVIAKRMRRPARCKRLRAVPAVTGGGALVAVDSIAIDRLPEFDDGLPPPNSPLWVPRWSEATLIAALCSLGVPNDVALHLVTNHSEQRVKRQLRASFYRRVRINAAQTVIDAIEHDRPLPQALTGEVPSPYDGVYKRAKAWTATQRDISQLLARNEVDRVRWIVDEPDRRATLTFERGVDLGAHGLSGRIRVRLTVPLSAMKGERNAAFRVLYHYLKAKFEALAFRFSDGTELLDFAQEFVGHVALEEGGEPRVLALPPAPRTGAPLSDVELRWKLFADLCAMYGGAS
jgi:hypothetical protein